MTNTERVTQAKVNRISPYLCWNGHTDEIVAKARKGVYMINILKKCWNQSIDLVRIDSYVIRPVVQNACVVWPTNFPKYLSDSINIIKNGVLKLYFLFM